MTCAAYKYNLRMQPSVEKRPCARYFVSSTENVVLHPLHPFSCECLCPHWIHIKFTNRSLCIVYLRCLRKQQMENKEHYYENRKRWDLKDTWHVNLTMSSQSKLCFGEDSSKQTWRKRDHCTVCSMNSSSCHYMKIRACTWKAQTVHHHSS